MKEPEILELLYLKLEDLVNPAKEVGIEVPDDLRWYSRKKFPYWNVFLKTQLNTKIKDFETPYKNAKLISQIKIKRINEISYEELLNLGLEIGE